MKLVNLDGLAIFGPGSEWLWAFAQFAALAITGLAIYRQLRHQAWANQLELFRWWNDDWNSVKMVRYKLAFHIEIAEGNRTLTPTLTVIGDWLDGVARARYNGHVNPRYAWEEFGYLAQVYWALILPLIPAFRTVEPDLWKDWERWLVEVAERDRKAGSIADLSPERLARWVPETIAYFIERLRVEEDQKSGVIPTWPPADPATAAPPAAPSAAPLI